MFGDQPPAGGGSSSTGQPPQYPSPSPPYSAPPTWRRSRQSQARGIINIVGGILLLFVFVFALAGAASLSSHGGGGYGFSIIIFGLLPGGLGAYRLITGIRELNNARTAPQPPSPVTSGQYPAPPTSPGNPPPAPATAPVSSGADRQHAVARAKRRIGIGGIWFGAGLLITIATYANAAGGGVYVVAWGPMLVGAYRIITGLVAFAKYRN